MSATASVFIPHTCDRLWMPWPENLSAIQGSLGRASCKALQHHLKLEFCLGNLNQTDQCRYVEQPTSACGWGQSLSYSKAPLSTDVFTAVYVLHLGHFRSGQTNSQTLILHILLFALVITNQQWSINKGQKTILPQGIKRSRDYLTTIISVVWVLFGQQNSAIHITWPT